MARNGVLGAWEGQKWAQNGLKTVISAVLGHEPRFVAKWAAERRMGGDRGLGVLDRINRIYRMGSRAGDFAGQNGEAS